MSALLESTLWLNLRLNLLLMFHAQVHMNLWKCPPQAIVCFFLIYHTSEYNNVIVSSEVAALKVIRFSLHGDFQTMNIQVHRHKLQHENFNSHLIYLGFFMNIFQRTERTPFLYTAICVFYVHMWTMFLILYLWPAVTLVSWFSTVSCLGGRTVTLIQSTLASNVDMKSIGQQLIKKLALTLKRMVT